MKEFMNEPLPLSDVAYIGVRGKDKWICCPHCDKPQFKIQDNTIIRNLEFKCKSTKCKFNMHVMV